MAQWIRQCTLLIEGASESFDVSELRITFHIKKSQQQEPNSATIKVFNLAEDTQNQITKEGKRVILQAGYQDGFGVIFDGQINQFVKGRENGTDTYLGIVATDGDIAYNHAIINTTIAAGSSQADHIKACQGVMGLQSTQIDSNTTRLPRGKVMYGNARDVMRQSTKSGGQNWSIQDGKLQVIATDNILKGQSILLNSQSGLVGVAEQTNDGISATCLLNPLIKVGSHVIINENDVMAMAFKPTPEGNAKKQQNGKMPKPTQGEKPALIAKDGSYKVISAEYTGDTRGNDWLIKMICLDISAIAKPKGATK